MQKFNVRVRPDLFIHTRDSYFLFFDITIDRFILFFTQKTKYLVFFFFFYFYYFCLVFLSQLFYIIYLFIYLLICILCYKGAIKRDQHYAILDGFLLKIAMYIFYQFFLRNIYNTTTILPAVWVPYRCRRNGTVDLFDQLPFVINLRSTHKITFSQQF